MVFVVINYGKYVYFEKLLVFNVVDVKEMVEVVCVKGVKMLVGFNYMKNLISQLVCEIIVNGEIGDIVYFYGIYNEDYLVDL